jgi:hypothetical protein
MKCGGEQRLEDKEVERALKEIDAIGHEECGEESIPGRSTT